MNIRNWSRQHTIGMIIGFIGPILYIPLVILILDLSDSITFERLWNHFLTERRIQGKFISLAIIPNLAWFYIFLNKEKFNFAMGIILGSILYLPYILYVNFS